MADTIITNTPPSDKSGDSGSGWAVALVIIIVIIAGLIYLYQRGSLNFGPAGDTYNTNIVVPETQKTTAPSGQTAPNNTSGGTQY